MPMKRKISTFLFGLLFLIGFGILIYPTVSNQWNTYRQNQLISSYDNTIQDMESEDFTSEWEKAKAFNDTIQQNNLYGDVFGEDENDIKDTEYWKILNVADDGVMGYLSIPKINIKLAIYHGTGDDQLEVGDKFYIHVLDEVLAYKVDQILPMVDKDDHETLEKALQIEEGKDQVTLFTCTPYGVNSHRLLVRGTRVPYNGEEDATESVTDSMVKAIQNYYMLYLILGLSITILVIILLRFLSKRKAHKE